jgi:tetratricopeptide (TPR) repeat protein
VDNLILTGERVLEGRLSPAQAHRLVHQKLEQLAAPCGLGAADVPFLVRQWSTRSYAPGEIVVPRGVRADCLGLIVRGQVAVQVGQRGDTRPAAVLLAGSTFGEAMLVEGRPSNVTMQALTRCEIRYLHRADVDVLIAKHQAEERQAKQWRFVGASVPVVLLVSLLVVALSLSSTRSALAVAPMGVGQWCAQARYDLCARGAWELASYLAPMDPNPLLALGDLYFQNGEVAAAEQAFEAAEALAPESPEAQNNLGVIYARAGDHERAVTAYQAALSLEPGVAIVEHNLAASLQATQAYADALEHYRAALALAEPQAPTLINMAVAYYQAGQPVQAVEMARQALLLNGSLAPAYTILGAVALESRQPEDAGYSQASFFLGLAYKSLGQTGEAIEAFEQALTTTDDGIMRARIRRHLDELYDTEQQSEVP